MIAARGFSRRVVGSSDFLGTSIFHDEKLVMVRIVGMCDHARELNVWVGNGLFLELDF